MIERRGQLIIILVRHEYTGGSYDPQVDGATDHVNYSEWRIRFVRVQP